MPRRRAVLSVLHSMVKKKGASGAADSPNDRWGQIIESLEEGVIGVDAAGRILSMNQAAEQLTACSLGATRGRHHSEVFEDSGWVSSLVDAVARGEPSSVSAEGVILG